MRLFGGLRPWVWQRLSAVLMVLMLGFAFGAILTADAVSLEIWREWFATRTAVVLAALVFFLALHWHAWIGLRDIVLDYVQPPVLRVAVLAGGVVGLVSLMMWVVVALLAVHGAGSGAGGL